ncbi:Sodium/proton-dependent alanine carrier protein [Calidithermus terrae]|uniref:Sodium/proton-dependent alanine carrier protein n=1 Tax=Calidithermus terrae TaxID=1408545 RepID=A0A399E2K3_9DEIN|nr:amino acid carrier protein [Calidithermus terrae]RIH78924.1 Sodium/proton-dependent alanine carrier protein [Calidithermus terrae]
MSFEAINQWLNGLVYGPVMMLAFLAAGLYLSGHTRFLQFTRFGVALRETLGAVRERSESFGGTITPFQAVMIALSGTVGTGHVVGMVAAILSGGPGAVLWMWLGYAVGSATKFAEATLAVHFRRHYADGSISGGAMYYVRQALGPRWGWVAGLFAVFAMFSAFGGGNLVQAKTLSETLQTSFGVPPAITGLLVAALAGVVLGGGIVGVARFASVVFPLKLLLFALAVVPLLAVYAEKIPAAFGLIFSSALSLEAAAGGAAGYTLVQIFQAGMGRGIFANEAGLGSSAFAHAQARVDHPVRQGLWGVTEMLTSFLVTTLTALAFLASGVWEGSLGGSPTEAAVRLFEAHFLHSSVLAVLLIVFAMGTLITWGFYGEEAAAYLFGEGVRWPFRLCYLVLAFMGPLGGLGTFLSLSDTLNGLMAIPNLLALAGLAGLVGRLVRGFFSGEAWVPPRGRDPDGR